MVNKTEMGILAKDVITGFKGTVIGRCEYISGCNQVLLAPYCKDDGTKIDSEWFDEQRIEQIGDRLAITLDNGATPGFDKAPERR